MVKKINYLKWVLQNQCYSFKILFRTKLNEFYNKIIVSYQLIMWISIKRKI